LKVGDWPRVDRLPFLQLLLVAVARSSCEGAETVHPSGRMTPAVAAFRATTNGRNRSATSVWSSVIPRHGSEFRDWPIARPLLPRLSRPR